MKTTWQDVPGWFDFQDIYNEAVDSAKGGSVLSHFVELGSYMGKSTLFMADAIAKSGKKIRFDAVDLWEHRPGFPTNTFFPEVIKEHGSLRNAFLHFLASSGLSDFVNVCQGDIVEKASSYRDGSLDFVFLDADHSYEGTRDQLLAYIPKIKPGGVLAGHDYENGHPGVVQAVKEIFPEAVKRNSSFWWQRLILSVSLFWLSEPRTNQELPSPFSGPCVSEYGRPS